MRGKQKQGRQRRPYSRPVVSRRRKLGDVTEGVNIFVTGQVSD